MLAGLDGDWEAVDDVKGGALDPTKEARAEEMGFINKLKVYKYSSVAVAQAVTGNRPISAVGRHR